MKRIKKYLKHIFSILGVLVAMWLISFIPAWLLNGVAAVSLVLSAILAIVLVCLCVKKMHKVLVVLLFVGLVFPAFAAEIEECERYDRSSVEEGNFCRYNILTESAGAKLCSYIKSFDPTKAKKGKDDEEMREQVNNANKIVQSYNELLEHQQRGLSSSCNLIKDEDKNKSVAEKRNILSNNSGAICCAWAMQSLFQIYTAENGERLVETVPMMMAEEKMQCWPCDVVYLLITLANTMAYRSAPAMASVAIFFLKWFFVFWLVLKVGALFIGRNFDGKAYTGPQFIKELFIRLVCVILAALVLIGTAEQVDDKTVTNMTRLHITRKETLLDEAYQKIVNPPFELIAGLGIEMTSTLLKGEKSFYGEVAKAADLHYRVAMTSTDYCSPKATVKSSPMYQHITRGGPSSEYKLDVTSQGRVISDDATRGLLCLTQLAFQGLSPISAAGSIITTHSIVNAWSLPFPLPGVLPLLPEMIYGLILLITCWLMGIAVGFRLIDIMVRVAMVAMLCPMFIVAAVFPITREKAKTAVVFFVSAVMGFVEVALAVGITVPCFYHAIAQSGREKELIAAMVAPSSSTYVTDLYNQFVRSGLIEDMKFFLYISVVGYMSFKLLDYVEKFFEQIFDVKNVGKIGAPKDASGNPIGGMASGMNSVRGFIGDTFDKSKEFVAKTRQYHKGISTGLENSVWSRAWGHVGRWSQHGYSRFKRGRIGQGASFLAGKARGLGRKLKNGYNWTKDKAKLAANKFKDSKVGQGLRSFGRGIKKFGHGVKDFTNNTRTGRALKAVVNNPFTRGVGRALKRAPSFAWDQIKQGISDFFHPPE